MSQIKVFQVDDAYWYAAETPADALKKYLSDAEEWGVLDEVKDNEIGEPVQIDDGALDKLRYMTDDDQSVTISFREQLNRLIASGEQFPQMFATTEI